MTALTSAARLAGCITLLALMTACSKKAEAPVEQAVELHAEAAPAAPRAREAVSTNMPVGSNEAKPAPPDTPDTPAPSVTTASAAQQLAGSGIVYNDGERKFIRTAKASFRVKDVYVAALGIEDTVASHGGFVVKNDITSNTLRIERQPVDKGKLIELKEYEVQGQLTVRVPSARTQEFLRAIAGHVVFLNERKFSAHDAQFDLLRQSLEAMRGQETQAELGDTLKDGGKLAQRADVIALRGEAKAARDAALLAKKESDDQVAFSTIELTLSQPSRMLRSELADVDSLFEQLQPGFASRLQDKLARGWDGALELLLALAGVWPLLLLGVLGGLPLWRALRRRKNGSTPG
ncbi:DUF4349 domain-containing protein [Massilia aquatica]|uniref:DUF4349 domain-containing protein n=1 Tax=Massilia aquatica TaxID=2609000 RepID=A0ABX0MIU7_9BURK|nr:DUF4349 domain-containing protein [Massilia aquatica]NHZ43399.1 DUF4349 domain-containing protein [Massilia aquatica]